MRPSGQYKQRSHSTLRHRSHTRTVHRPRMPSRVGTSQPQAFAFDVHAQTHAAKLWSPGFCMRRTWGERAKGAVGNRGDSRSKTESICRVTQDKPSSRQSISLTSHVSDERRARARKPCVGEDLRLRCFARLAQQASVSLNRRRNGKMHS